MTMTIRKTTIDEFLTQQQTEMNIDAELSQYIIEKFKPNFQRPINKNAIHRFSLEMRNGRWLKDIPITFGIIMNGRHEEKLLLDGQHRLKAIIQAQVTQPLKINWMKFGNIEEAKEFYAVIDRGTNRNIKALLRAFGKDNNLTATESSRYVNAVIYIHNEFKFIEPFTRIPDSTIWELTEQYNKEAIEYIDIIMASNFEKKLKDMCLNSGFMAFCIKLLSIEPNNQFLADFVDVYPENLMSAPQALLFWLRNYKKNTSTKLTDVHLFNAVATAYKCFLNGKNVDKLKVSSPWIVAGKTKKFDSNRIVKLKGFNK